MINCVIFDYGGVFTLRSRTELFSRSLSLSFDENVLLKSFFLSKFIRNAAIGLHSEDEIIQGLLEIFPMKKKIEISKAFDFACEPDPHQIELLNKLKIKNYKIVLISNSLPPYSSRILKNKLLNFDYFYLSDVFGARKPNDLFEIIQTIDANIFKSSIYIDDDIENLSYPKKFGAIPIQFKGVGPLISSLEKFDVI